MSGCFSDKCNSCNLASSDACPKGQLLKLQHDLELRDMVLSILSHDMRNSFNHLHLIIEILKLGHVKEAIQALGDSLAIMVPLFNSILELRKIEARGLVSLNSAPTDLNYLLSSFFNIFRSQIEKSKKNVSFLVAFPELPIVVIDGDRLTTILFNLLNNAVKFTDNGNIFVEIKLIENSLVFEISDTGVGISENEKDGVFELYQQTSYGRQRKGIGIGLAVVKTFIDAMGGNISFESQVGIGTVFWVTIPILEIVDEGSSAVTKNHPLPKILLVDDSPDVLRILEIMLKKLTPEVTATSDIDDARELYRSNDFDIVVVDGHIHGECGCELIVLLRKIEEEGDREPARIIMLTGDDSREDLALKSGADLFLLKPVSKNIIAKIIS